MKARPDPWDQFPRLPLEPAGPDFPYHPGNPPILTARGWGQVMMGVVLGFLALTLPLPFTDTLLSGWLREKDARHLMRGAKKARHLLFS